MLHFEGKPQRRVGGRGIAAPASGDIAATAARCTDEASTLLQASLYIGHNQDTGGEGSLSGATQFRLEQQPAPGPTEALSSNGGLLAVATAAADCSIAVLAVFYGGPRYPPETDELHPKSTHRKRLPDDSPRTAEAGFRSSFAATCSARSASRPAARSKTPRPWPRMKARARPALRLIVPDWTQSVP